MATVNLTTTPTQVDDGSSYTVLVTNTGAVTVDLSRGGRLRPGQAATVYPEGAWSRSPITPESSLTSAHGTATSFWVVTSRPRSTASS